MSAPLKKLPYALLVDDYLHSCIYSQIVVNDSGRVNKMEYILDPRKALSHLESSRNSLPQVLFIDLYMPVMNGFDFIDACQEIYKGSDTNVCVYIMSVSLNPSDKRKAEAHTFISGFVEKPITPELIGAIADEYGR